MNNFGKGIDKTVFWPATIVTLLFGLLFFIYPEQSNDILNKVHAFTTHELGWFFLIITVILLGICFYFAFSKIGNIVLGDENDTPAYSTFTWLGMVLTSGSGGSLLYLGAIEWIWIADAPPFGIEPRSIDAYRWASAYGMFHWGPSAWAFYVACAVPIAYFYFVKKKSNMKMSDYARPLIGKRADGLTGSALNFLYIFGLLGGVLTSLALGTPPISSGIAHILGMESSNTLIDVLVITAWTFIPLAALIIGLQKGVSKLSDWNVKGFIVLLIFIMLFGPTWFIFNQSTDALGLMLQNYMYMSLQTDPIRDSGFPQAWTVFYMSWWAVYALPFGLFIAKISKGRTIRQMVLGALAAGSLGCMMFYMVLPNMGIYLQRSGAVDLFTSLAEKGRGGVVVDMFKNVPGGTLVVAFFTLLVLISYITGHCSVGYSLAAASEKKMKGDQDPQKWNMAFWLVLAGIVSLGLYLLNPSALQPLQTVSIVTGFPICFAIGVLILAFFKQLKKDFPDGIQDGSRIYGTPEEENEIE
ncbi:BCCT family transporter [Lachnospiraceae bacterium 62-35]